MLPLEDAFWADPNNRRIPVDILPDDPMFIQRRRENPYFSLNEKSLPCVGSERSERPNRAMDGEPTSIENMLEHMAEDRPEVAKTLNDNKHLWKAIMKYELR